LQKPSMGKHYRPKFVLEILDIKKDRKSTC
jgi:hypothetical protein